VLEEFQERMLADYFRGVRETLICLPKKAGKTSLLGALALYHLLTTPDAECVIAAASREQATILYDQAAGYIRRSPGLEDRVDVKRGYREIRSRRDSGRIRVLAADVNTADGVIPTLALVDELHRHKTGDLYGVFRDGLGPRGGQLITISTAGDDEESPLGRLRRKGLELPDVKRVRTASESYTCARAAGYVMHEWALDPEDDRDDMDVVKRANPASWQTVEALRERHDSPSTTPWQWARFACGVWEQGEDRWLQPQQWDALCDPAVEIPAGAEVWAGVDLGVRHDSTAIVTVCRLEGGRWAARAEVVEPPGGDGSVSVAEIEDRIRALGRRHRLLGVAYDPWSFRRSAELLEADGILMVEHPMSQERMALASAGLYRLIDEGVLVHDGDPVLRAHVLAGSVKQTERGWRLVKDRHAKRPIDALIALAIAVSVAGEVRKPSVYEQRGLLTV